MNKNQSVVLAVFFVSIAPASGAPSSRKISEVELKFVAVEKPELTQLADYDPTADIRPMAEYWAGTGMRFQHLRAEVSDESCERNGQQFMACLAAMNSLASALPRRGRVLSTALSTQRLQRAQSQIVASGSFSLVEYPGVDSAEEADSSPAASWRRYQERLQSEQNAALASFSSAGASALDVSRMLEELRQRAITRTNEAQTSAHAFNALLSVQHDPHTYLIPTQYESDRAATPASTFSGVGMNLATVGSSIRITSVFENGPAHQGGVYTGDLLVRVASREVSGMPLDQIINLIKGPAGTPVEIQVSRNGALHSLTLTRRTISQPNVDGRLFRDGATRIGYVRMRTFSESTACDTIASYIQNLHQLQAQGMILDLRGNGGGYTAQAVCIAGLFLGRGKAVYQERRISDGRTVTILTDRNQVTTLPLMLMLDGQSASASELLAGALQDHRRAFVAGQRSFGKATVQYALPYAIAGITLRQTVSRFFRPSGLSNQVVGITPDFELEPVPNPTEDDLFVTREGDLYTNALPPVGAQWVQPRPQEIARIQARCAGHDGRVATRYEQAQRGPLAADYMLIRATDLMGCVANGGTTLARH